MEAGVEIQRRQLVPAEPPEVSGLRGETTQRRAWGRDDEIAEIEVPVSGLIASRRDGVDVDVHRARRRGMKREPLDPRLFPRLAQGDRLTAPFTRLGVAAGLEPPAKLPVVEQQDLVARRRDHDGAAREVPLEDAAMEGVRVTVDELEDLGQVRRFLGIGRRVPPELGAKVRVARGIGPTLRPGRRRQRLIHPRDVRALLAGNHDLQHGRAMGRRCQRHAGRSVWHTRAVGLGRTTRFAPLPPGSRRVSVMRAGAGGIKALAPSPELLADFQAKKRALIRVGKTADQAHAEAHSLLGYRERYLAEIKARPEAIPALRQLIAEARTSDVYVMCMCPYRTPGRACHTYALLDLARELEPGLLELPEPIPKRHAAARQQSGGER